MFSRELEERIEEIYDTMNIAEIKEELKKTYNIQLDKPTKIGLAVQLAEAEHAIKEFGALLKGKKHTKDGGSV